MEKTSMGTGKVYRMVAWISWEVLKEHVVLVKRLWRAPSGWFQLSSAAVPTRWRDVQTLDSRPRSCRRRHQLRPFCAILALGGCGLVFPRERGSLLVSACPRESFPSGRMGLDSALGYVPGITRCGWCSAFGTWSQSVGLPCFVRITYGQIHLNKRKEKMNSECGKHFGSTSKSTGM